MHTRLTALLLSVASVASVAGEAEDAYRRLLRDQVAAQVCQGRSFETTLAQLLTPHREDYGRDYLVGVPGREAFARDDGQFADHVRAAFQKLTTPPPRPPDDDRPHALVLIGDHYHPPDYSRPPMAAALKLAGVPAAFLYDATKLTAASLKGRRLLVIFRDGIHWPDPAAMKMHWWLTDRQEQAITAFVRRGGGLLALHGATALRPWEGEPTPEFNRLLGARYDGHGAADEKFTVRAIRKDHPVTRGVTGFAAIDERHRPTRLASDATVLLEAVAGRARSVNAFVRMEGKGRVCYLANGHNRQVLSLPQVQRLIANAARWCCGIGD